MPPVSKANASAVFELKSAALPLVAVMLKTTDLAAVARELDERLAQSPNLFDQDPVAIDLSQVAEDDAPVDFPALIALLTEHRMRPLAVRGGGPGQREAAQAAGLVEAPLGGGAPARPTASAAPPVPAVTLTEVIAPVAPPPPPPTTTLIVDRPLRSGQQVYAKGGDLVVLAAVNFGAEVIADGSIHVYAPLRGRAIAGARGHAGARIFATSMEPQLVSVAGTYRTTEAPLPPEVLGKPAQVRLDGDKLIFEPLKP